MRSFISAALLAMSTGCALGHVRHVEVQPLGPYRDLEAARVQVEGEGPVADALRQSVSRSLENCAHLHPAEPGEPAYEVRVAISDDEGQRVFTRGGPVPALWRAAANLGLAGLAFGSGRLAFDETVYANGVEVGSVRWDGTGTPEELAPEAGQEAGSVLAHTMEARKDEWASRRAGDERLFLIPTPLTMTPGEFTFQYDELLVTHAAVGLPHRFELDFWAGAVPIPSAGGAVAILPHTVLAKGGVGVLYAGFFDAGLKLRVLDEGALLPGLSIGYDMLDIAGDALTVGGGIAVNDSIVGQAGIGGGTSNMQFNVITVSAGKHFGDTQLVGGAYFIDNHHFLPQSAHFAVVSAKMNETENGTQIAGSINAGSSSVDTMPLQVQPFAGVEHTLGRHATLAAELLPRAPWYESVATTGVKWRFGFSRPWGPLAVDRLRVTIDLAGAWTYIPTSARSGVILPLPYLGAGFYVM